MRDITRRDALAGITATGALALAGCVAQNDDDDQTGSDDDDSAVEIIETSITSTGETASGDTDTVDGYVTNDDVITVSGSLQAPNPCHEATLEDASVGDGELSLEIDVTELDEEKACIDVLGRVDYDVEVELSDTAAIETVTVDHVDGGTHTAPETAMDGDTGASQGSSPPGIVDYSVETTAATCGGVDRHSVDRTNSTVTIEGAIPTSTPCYKARLGNLSVDGNELTVQVGVESDLGEDEACVECTGQVEYRVELTLENPGAVDDVTVEHLGGIDGIGDSMDGDARTGETGIASSKIQTTATDTRSDDPDTATTTRDGRVVSVDGVLPASHPHHEAYLAEAGVKEGTLSVTVDVRSTLDDQMGTQPLGEVDYESELELAADVAVETVVVNHATGESHEASV